MNFNFCRFYNKTMNALEAKCSKNGIGTIGENPRENSPRINIFLGIFSIIMIILSMYLLIFVTKIENICEYILNLTTSECPIKNNEKNNILPSFFTQNYLYINFLL